MRVFHPFLLFVLIGFVLQLCVNGDRPKIILTEDEFDSSPIPIPIRATPVPMPMPIPIPISVPSSPSSLNEFGVEHQLLKTPVLHYLTSTAFAEQIEATHHYALGRPSLYENLENLNPLIAERAEASLNCSICQTVVAAIEPSLLTNSTFEIVVAVAKVACQVIKPLCHSPDACTQVCDGIVSAYANGVWTIVGQVATPLTICALLKQCPVPPKPTPSTAIPVPSHLDNKVGETAWPSWELTTGTGTFLHLSDGHIDVDYMVGALSQCPLPVCCHRSDGMGTNVSNSAGYWGDHGCDTAPQLVANVFEYIAQMQPQPDFIIYTGDDPSHDVWKQSESENLNALNLWTKMFNDIVGAPNSIPIFHTLGNHEIWPVNQYRGPVYDSWLYDAAVEAYGPNLPEDAQSTMAYGGYYQARARPGLRVISLNSNYFVDDNFWLLANLTDAYDQLNWFADVMRQVSSLNEKAIIICHASVHEWNSDLADAFLIIAEQYQTNIVNYFMGHTHYNQYQALHDSKGNPMAVTFIGGSIVPFTAVNPGFQVYSYSRDEVAASNPSYTYLVKSAVSHWLDLNQANAANDTDAQWPIQRFDMAAEYGLPDLSPASMATLSSQYSTNSTLYTAYVNSQFKGYVPKSGGPSAESIACLTSTNTGKEYHACLHKAGMKEKKIQKARETESLC